jgi:hypothetical protein
VREVIDVSGFASIFGMHADADAAITALAQ